MHGDSQEKHVGKATDQDCGTLPAVLNAPKKGGGLIQHERWKRTAENQN